MSNLFSQINARIGGTSSKTGPKESPRVTNNRPSQSHNHPSSTNPALRVSLLHSPSLSEPMGIMSQVFESPQPLPLWLNPVYVKQIVRGNLMTLSVRPKTVEPGEWVAYQVVEQYRNLWNFVRIIHEKELDGNSICNPTTCPKMSAGDHSYTWLNQDQEPAEFPARESMTLTQRWITGKIDNDTIFPTNPLGASFANCPEYSNSIGLPHYNEDWLGIQSGFPKQFGVTCQLMFRQIFRIYAHLYWNHFVEPFYHLNLEKHLDSCFSSFILTATSLDMLRRDELEPMQDLINLWAADGTFQHSRGLLNVPIWSEANTY
ncbi:Maintenance of ploidy protein mob2 [Tolypocladium capitatum]|uniref:Maintenance of ploidy protein mob2 n=1 Tax=Tolypocladium capitatum TaxID=45235 RepID=A0A2K3Q4U4_9HYPO|nr:Maintenance of ploidy protein mob2 [Tolypocladium capitatum]